MSESKVHYPQAHVNEEPRNDFMDTAVGFAGMFGFIVIVTIIATVITIL